MKKTIMALLLIIPLVGKSATGFQVNDGSANPFSISGDGSGNFTISGYNSLAIGLGNWAITGTGNAGGLTIDGGINRLQNISSNSINSINIGQIDGLGVITNQLPIVLLGTTNVVSTNNYNVTTVQTNIMGNSQITLTHPGTYLIRGSFTLLSPAATFSTDIATTFNFWRINNMPGSIGYGNNMVIPGQESGYTVKQDVTLPEFTYATTNSTDTISIYVGYSGTFTYRNFIIETPSLTAQRIY